MTYFAHIVSIYLPFLILVPEYHLPYHIKGIYTYIIHKYELTCYFFEAGVDPSGEEDKNKERERTDRIKQLDKFKSLNNLLSEIKYKDKTLHL